MPASRSNDVGHWETYYRGGSLASCPFGPHADYTQELRDVWVEFFAGLPDGARILDIGTGNGAIALIASQAGAETSRRFEIHGTDLARIDPVRDVAGGGQLFAGVRFHPEVATERLPFESAGFDAVSGQYALEYSDPGRALPEIHRVLRPGGAAQFVLHHADSIIASNARESLVQSALVLEETKILRLLRRHLAAEQRTKAAARRAGSDLSAALATLAQAAEKTQNRLTLDVAIDAVQKLLQARGSLDAVRLNREIDGFEGQLRGAARRLDDLVRCALSDGAIDRLATIARQSGFREPECRLQHHARDMLVGWRVRLERPQEDKP